MSAAAASADESAKDAASEKSESRLDVAIAILLAVVAVTAALAAWRTSAVGSAVADTNRAGIIDVTKQAAMHHINESSAYAEADYAAQTALKAAEAKALIASGLPGLTAAGTSLQDNLVPSMAKLAGPFPDGSLNTPAGTFDVPGRISQLESADPVFQGIVPATSFATADNYANEKRWLTILSVLLAIALFWLGMAEISRGRWRLVNMVVGVALWVVGVGAFLIIEAWFVTSRGGAL
jgi:hypothetical protein